jgi:hypothetical protein
MNSKLAFSFSLSLESSLASQAKRFDSLACIFKVAFVSKSVLPCCSANLALHDHGTKLLFSSIAKSSSSSFHGLSGGLFAGKGDQSLLASLPNSLSMSVGGSTFLHMLLPEEPDPQSTTSIARVGKLVQSNKITERCMQF